MPQYTYRVTLQGSTPSDKTTLVYNLGEHVDEISAMLSVSALTPVLLAVTTATISMETLTSVISSSNALPADPAVDTFEELALSCHLNAPTEQQKLVLQRIPAPDLSLLVPDGEKGDLTNADLIGYVNILAAATFVSDGEVINITSGTGGISDTWKRTRARKFKK